MIYLEWHLDEGHRASQGSNRVVGRSEMKKERKVCQPDGYQEEQALNIRREAEI